MSKIITTENLTDYMQQELTVGVAEAVVDAINQWVETTTSRCWGELATVTERCDWGSCIWLRHMDVQSVGYVKLGYPGRPQTLLDSSGYFFSTLGRLTLSFGSPSSFYPSPGNN